MATSAPSHSVELGPTDWPYVRYLPTSGADLADCAAAIAAWMRRLIGLADADAIDDGALSALLAVGGFELLVTETLDTPNGGAEAMLVPSEDDDRFVIVADPRPRNGWAVAPQSERAAVERRRLRFRTGHELGHSVFYWRGASRAPRRNRAIDEREERFCDLFAAALLLPRAAFMATTRAAEAYALADRFDVSAQVVARALAGEPDVVAVSLLITTEQGPRVQWSSDDSAAARAVREVLGYQTARPGPEVDWATCGRQALRLERRRALIDARY